MTAATPIRQFQPDAAVAAASPEFTAAELGAIAHLYRGEVYRSTIWRTRLDTTTNWAVVVTGIALSIAFGSPTSTPLPLLLVGLLVAVFLLLEARRYRYFNVWRARARLLETDFYAPMLRRSGGHPDDRWNVLLAGDYERPQFHIGYACAVGRRLRKNYCWIFLMQILAYFGKLVVHPTPLGGISEILQRASIGPIPGFVVLSVGLAFHLGWIAFAFGTLALELRRRRISRTLVAIA